MRQMLVLFALFYLLIAQSCKEEDTKTAATTPTPRATPVEGLVVENSAVDETINATGSLIANETVEIRPERAGRLVSLNFQESSNVQSGKLLAQIDDSELLAQRSRLMINLDLAKKEVARGDELLQIQGISEEEMDRLQNRVEDINAEVKILDIQIEKSKVHAPFSGVLGLRQISRGAYITPTDVIVDLQQIHPIKLEFDVPERYLTKVRENQPLEFTVVGADETFAAKVYAIGAEISPATRTFKVRATANNRAGLLKPGQFAKVNLVTGTNNKAILVPTDAVVPVLEGKQVFVARNGRAIASKVATGNRMADEIEILDGLMAGDTIITTGLLSLSDGALIEVNVPETTQNASL
ncbi:MAG: efflux RND transporter periplasmic adaptor subunit [Bacteroidota bacterium]